jgi:cytochrome c oxidase assembly protein subunit 15
MVAVGGLTRLTDSGLSITAWELFTGIFPPLNVKDWNFYFSEYKKIPEYENINYGMSLDEFKIIFYWEYAHRLLARFVGLFTLIPLIFWYILDIYKTKKFHKRIPNLLLLLILKLIVLQIVLGAFLSGLDGGLIYNSWPDMNGSFFPNDVGYNDVINTQLFNNPSIVQFLHRVTAYLLLFFIIILNYLYIKNNYGTKNIILFDIAILVQIFLGIITLLSGVEIKYASLHQLGSIFVLTTYLTIIYKNSNQQLELY